MNSIISKIKSGNLFEAQQEIGKTLNRKMLATMHEEVSPLMKQVYGDVGMGIFEEDEAAFVDDEEAGGCGCTNEAFDKNKNLYKIEFRARGKREDKVQTKEYQAKTEKEAVEMWKKDYPFGSVLDTEMIRPANKK